MDDSDLHICSFIVQFLPKDAPAIAIEISSIEEAEIVFAMSADEGKLILLMNLKMQTFCTKRSSQYKTSPECLLFRLSIISKRMKTMRSAHE